MVPSNSEHLLFFHLQIVVLQIFVLISLRENGSCSTITITTSDYANCIKQLHFNVNNSLIDLYIQDLQLKILLPFVIT